MRISLLILNPHLPRSIAGNLRSFGDKSFPSFFQGGETYLFINQIIIITFAIEKFLRLTAMPPGV